MTESLSQNTNHVDIQIQHQKFDQGENFVTFGTRKTRLLDRLWEFTLSRLLQNFEIGQITLRFPNGKTVHYGNSESEPSAYMRVRNHRMIRKLLVEGDVGLAESYMDGDWESPDLVPILELGPRNVEAIENKILGLKLFRLKNLFQHLKRPNNHLGSRKNIAEHYDLGNDFYRHWLDSTMTYSSALFDNHHSQIDSTTEEILKEGQIKKYRYIADRLQLKPGMKVLEIGCGWGGFMELAAKEYGCHVDGITISKEQFEFASKRAQKAGLSDLIKLFFMDYRDLDGNYDKIVSIEMLEAVGEKNWPIYFNKVNELLTDQGEALIQSILIEDWRFDDYRKKADFIQCYIFPGGMLPSLEVLKRIFPDQGMELQHVMHFGDSYAQTMSLWNRLFQEAWLQIKQFGFDSRFKRMWEYYLAYCETGFRTGAIDVAMLHLKKTASI